MGHLYLGLAIVCNVLGQYVLKSGVNQVGEITVSVGGILKVFMNLSVLGGFAIYGVGSIFWILTLSKHELSYAYPLLSLGYIAVIFISWFLLGEQITAMRATGAALYLVSIFLIFSSA